MVSTKYFSLNSRFTNIHSLQHLMCLIGQLGFCIFSMYAKHKCFPEAQMKTGWIFWTAECRQRKGCAVSVSRAPHHFLACAQVGILFQVTSSLRTSWKDAIAFMAVTTVIPTVGKWRDNQARGPHELVPNASSQGEAVTSFSCQREVGDGGSWLTTISQGQRNGLY